MKRSTRGCGCAIAVLVVLLGGAAGAFWKWGRPWLKARPPKPTGELQVHVLDVGPGEGDSILIVSPTGTSVLIDAGDAGKGKAVLAALKQYKIEKLDYFIASHPHPDHIGGADEVINQIKVGTVIDIAEPTVHVLLDEDWSRELQHAWRPFGDPRPRIVPSAKKLGEISYDEMLELASLGAKVMQSRSVEFAKKFRVVFEVRSSLNENPGTIVKEETKSMEGVVVRGVSLDKNQAKVTLVAVPDKPGVAARIFKAIGDANVNVDMIVQNISHGSGKPATDLSFTVDKPVLLKAQKVIEALKKDIGFGQVIATENIGKLSIVGVGMKSHSGVAGKMFEILAHEGVNIDMISTSEIKISVVIDLAKGEAATRAVHAAFIG